MKITRNQLNKIVHLTLLNEILLVEKHDPGDLVRVDDIDTIVIARYDVGRAPYYIVYNPQKNTKLSGTIRMDHRTIDSYIKNDYVKWAPLGNNTGKLWNTIPKRLKTLLDRGQLSMISDFKKVKSVKVDKDIIQPIDLVTGLQWGLLGIGFVADLLPGAGTLVSTAANIGSMGIALKKKNYLGVALAILAIHVPGLGDSLAILGKAVQGGAKLPKTVAGAILGSLVKVSDKQLRSYLTKTSQDMHISMTKSTIAGITKSVSKFRKSLEGMV